MEKAIDYINFNIFEEIMNQKQLEIEIQICTNCKSHSWCTRHDQKKYQVHFQQINKNITAQDHSIKIIKKFANQKKLGAFQILCEGKLLYSKLQCGYFPNISQVTSKIINFINDLRENKNVSRYDINSQQYRLTQSLSFSPSKTKYAKGDSKNRTIRLGNKTSSTNDNLGRVRSSKQDMVIIPSMLNKECLDERLIQRKDINKQQEKKQLQINKDKKQVKKVQSQIKQEQKKVIKKEIEKEIVKEIVKQIEKEIVKQEKNQVQNKNDSIKIQQNSKDMVIIGQKQMKQEKTGEQQNMEKKRNKQKDMTNRKQQEMIINRVKEKQEEKKQETSLKQDEVNNIRYQEQKQKNQNNIQQHQIQSPINQKAQTLQNHKNDHHQVIENKNS